ncbi:MAG: hypothetical protein ACXVCE_11235 [Bacteriovorax sp.]
MRFYLSFLLMMIALPSWAKAGCKNADPVKVVQQRVNGVHGTVLAKQIIFKCEDGSSGVGLYLNYEGGLIQKVQKYFKPDNFAFWIKINQAELKHQELLLGSDPEYWRNATWDTIACLSSLPTDADLGENCPPQLSKDSQRAVLFKNVVGNRILPWDIEIAIAYKDTNEWDNNGGPSSNYKIHFDENNLKNPHGGDDEL